MTAAIENAPALPEPRGDEQQARVVVDTDTIDIRRLRVHNSEAAAIAAAEQARGGEPAVAELLTRAIPVGLLAVSMTAAGIDTGSVRRTLDGFADDLDSRSTAAVAQLQATIDRAKAGEQNIATTAEKALAELPTRLDTLLAGEANTVRDAVTHAAGEVQAAAADELRRALAHHAQQMRAVLSLDTDGPVQALRRDVLAGLDGTRRELTEQLTGVRELLSAAEAARAAGSKSSRARGSEFEAEACDRMGQIATAAGDQWEDIGAAPAAGTTRRSGDGLATLSRLATGGTDVRIVIEAKRRSRPLTVDAWRKELAASCENRDAVAALAIVPAIDDVPGPGGICRIADRQFAVAIDQPIDIIYRVLRELAVIHSVGTTDSEVDLARVESNIKLALSGLDDLDQLGRLVNTASNSLKNAMEVGGRARKRIHDALQTGLATLHA